MRQNFRAIEMADRMNYKRDQDLEINNNRIILTSPNGTRYAVTVDNAGVLSTVVV
jgi:phosphosulfolactate phosphohydrolase-like enzyme